MADSLSVATIEPPTRPSNCGTSDAINSPDALKDVSSSTPTAEATIPVPQEGNDEALISPPVLADPSGSYLKDEVRQLKAQLEKLERKVVIQKEEMTLQVRRQLNTKRVEKLLDRVRDSDRYTDALENKLSLIEQELEYIEEYERRLGDIIGENEELEMQIEELNKELEDWRLGGQGKNISAHKSEVDDSKARFVKPELSHMGWKRFKGQRLLQTESISAIEVLEGDPIITYENFTLPAWHSRLAQYPILVPSDENLDTEGDKGQQSRHISGPGQGPVPERIRINSMHIVRIFEEIHGEKILGKDAALVMTRPYKALMYYGPQIRDKFKRLESKFGGGKRQYQ
jgi:hypothetical protein